MCVNFLFSPSCCILAGFSLNNSLHQIIVARYSDPNLTIDFDNFVGSLIRLESLFSKFSLCDPILSLQPCRYYVAL